MPGAKIYDNSTTVYEDSRLFDSPDIAIFTWNIEHRPIPSSVNFTYIL